MYRGCLSLRSKLARLAPPVAPRELGLLADLRAKIDGILEKTARREARSRAVDTPDLPFVTSETPLGPLHLRTQRLSAAHRMGRASLLPSRDASSELLALLALDPTIAPRKLAGALYLDTETTGLAGGTGTVAFLVGLARWAPAEREDGHTSGGLILEQLLVRNLGEEGPMLEFVARRIREASMLVTFNGKSFDLPLLRTRFVMARIARPEEPPHLDLLHVARRLHKRRGVECKLTTIEREVLGFERVDDCPSGEVSAHYLHFLRTGETRALLGVIEHNAWDVVAMAALVGLYGEPLEGSALAPADLIGLARTLKRAGKVDHALAAVTLAVERGAGSDSLRARAEICKARGERDHALRDYAALSELVDDVHVRLELAKLYEHFAKEPARALAIVAQGTGETTAATEKRSLRLSRQASRPKQAALFPQNPTAPRRSRQT